MLIVRQLYKKFIYLLKYTLSYVFCAFFIIGIFSLWYNSLGIESPWDNSINIFCGIKYDNNIPYKFIILELGFRNILFIAWIGSFLSNFLSPINPIYFSKNIVCNNDDKLRVRYWIMTSYKQYLYNVNIRFILSEGPFINRGVNKTPTVWEYNEDYELMRGVRYIELNKEKTEEVLSKSKQLERPYFTVRIQGQNKTGVTFFAQKMYSAKTNILYGYDFVYTFQQECVNLAQKLGYTCENVDKLKKKHLIRYENFDKVYSTSNLEMHSIFTRNDDIFSLEQIIFGQYGKSISQCIVDCFNYLISIYLNKLLIKDEIEYNSNN